MKLTPAQRASWLFFFVTYRVKSVHMGRWRRGVRGALFDPARIALAMAYAIWR
jgi:hypothetical protein